MRIQEVLNLKTREMHRKDRGGRNCFNLESKDELINAVFFKYYRTILLRIALNCKQPQSILASCGCICRLLLSVIVNTAHEGSAVVTCTKCAISLGGRVGIPSQRIHSVQSHNARTLPLDCQTKPRACLSYI